MKINSLLLLNFLGLFKCYKTEKKEANSFFFFRIENSPLLPDIMFNIELSLRGFLIVVNVWYAKFKFLIRSNLPSYDVRIPNFTSINWKTTKGYQMLKWSPKVWMVTNDHQRSIFTFGQVCLLKINLNIKFHIDWLKKTLKSPKVIKGHQRSLNVKSIIGSNLSFCQICIHMIYLHMKFHINWLKNNQRSPKVIRDIYS